MTSQRNNPRSDLAGWFWRALAFAFGVTLVVASYLVYITVRDYFANQQMIALADTTVPTIATPEPDATPAPELPRWNGHGRVNVLLLGIDQREGEEGPWRTDTILVLTLDPVTMSAGMLSIPRDLWVSIPGYGERNRINTAHYYGDAYGYPGGGPALARDTVAWNVGVPIHFYARINFTAFETVIDEIGGIDIDVPETIDDPYYPDEGYGYDPFYIDAGPQHLDGKTALKYARTRATFGGDFDRGRRQQAVIVAVRDKVVKLDQLPRLISRAPALINSLGDAIRTDMSLDQAIQLARLASEIDPDQIVTAVLDHNYTSAWETPDGAQVLIANREAMRELRSVLFAEPLPAGDSSTVVEHLTEEGARILILNGSATGGLARSTSEFLTDLDYQVVDVGDAGAQYENTLIIDYAGKPFTSKQLATLFRLPLSNVISGSSPDGDYDLALILGNDFELPGEG
jgi:LCP family protein required for cell wall assembly